LSRETLIGELVDKIRAAQNATDALDEAAAKYLGLNRTDLRALDVIDRTGRISAGDLAREMHLTSGAVTTVLDRLERAGYARRVADERDRRRVLVEVTPAIRRLGAEFYGSPEEATAAFDGYTIEQLELLLDFTRRNIEWNEQRVARVREELAKRKKPR
jgi:DNA-binding MarR family transcriptional regulator